MSDTTNNHKASLYALIGQAIRQIKYTTDAIVGWTALINGSEKMKANEDAQIYQHLYRSFDNILEPDIYPRLFSDQSHQKVITIADHRLEITVFHREPKIEKLTGVDVSYRIYDWKMLNFQHKKRDNQGKLSALSKREKEQRNKITNLCNFCRLPRRLQDDDGFVRPYCASVYVIGDADGAIRHVVSACQLDKYRQFYGQSSTVYQETFPKPSDMDTVDNMFLQCTIGRRFKKPKDLVDLASIEDAFITGPDLLFHAHLRKANNTEE